MIGYVLKRALTSVVERKNMTLVEIARTMLIDSGLGMSFWAKVDNTTCYANNRCLKRFVINKKPYELLNDTKPSTSHVGTFGCKCFVLNNGEITYENLML